MLERVIRSRYKRSYEIFEGFESVDNNLNEFGINEVFYKVSNDAKAMNYNNVQCKLNKV